jgi:HEAT repeat protein
MLETYNGLTQSDALDVVMRAHPRTLDSFDALLQYHSRTVRTLVADALGRIGDPRSIPILERASRDAEYEIKCAAENALIEIYRGKM